MFFDTRFASSLKQLPPFGERQDGHNFSVDSEPAVRDSMLPYVAAASRREDKLLTVLRKRWNDLPAEFRDELITDCLDEKVTNLSSLIERWVMLPASIKAHFAAKLATHPLVAGEAGNFSASSAEPMMTIIAGRFVRGGNEVFTAGKWRLMTSEERRFLSVR